MHPVFAPSLFNSWIKDFNFLKLNCWACNLALRQSALATTWEKAVTANVRQVFRGPTFKSSHAIVIDSHQLFDICVFFTIIDFNVSLRNTSHWSPARTVIDETSWFRIMQPGFKIASINHLWFNYTSQWHPIEKCGFQEPWPTLAQVAERNSARLCKPQQFQAGGSVHG